MTLEGPDGKPKKINLSHDEPINEQLADVHVKHAGKIISEKLRTLKAAFDERHDKRTVAEYKARVRIIFISQNRLFSVKRQFSKNRHFSENRQFSVKKVNINPEKAFVQMMPQLNKERDILTAHSEMCSKVISSVDELQYAALTTNESTLERIWTGEDEVEWEAALKIMCLVSWRNGGLRLVL